MPVARSRVLFNGFVQGVGFRYTSRRLAGRFAITGWVRNCPDGTVELEAQGEKSEVEMYIQSLCAEMRGHVRDHTICWECVQDGEAGFDVRF